MSPVLSWETRGDTRAPYGSVLASNGQILERNAQALVAADPYFTPQAPIGKGDLDEDGCVEADDLGILAEQWLERCRVDEWCGGRDINRSSRVDFLDFAILASHWLEGCE